MPPVLGYWKIRGLAQPIRLLLQYAGEEYEEKRYHAGGPNWMDEKEKLDLPFPNLPYYKDGKVSLTQSNAILRYIARKYNLLGETAEEQGVVDMLLDTCMDYRIGAATVFYNENFESLKPGLLVDVNSKVFPKLVEWGKGKTWFLGDKITVVDFVIYEYLKLMEAFEKSLFDKFAWLNEFIARFEALPAIKAYQASPDFIQYPFNGAIAYWGGK